MLNALSDKLSIITESLNFITPEVLITLSILFLLILDLVIKEKGYKWIWIISFGLTVLLLMTDVAQFGYTEEGPITLFLGMMQLDQLAVFWKLLIDAGMLLILCMQFRNGIVHYKAEFVIILFIILLGSHILIMSANLLLVYLSIEIMSIGAYVLTTYKREIGGYEAAIKYLLVGGVSSAVMLYGISLIYTLAGTLDFTDAQLVETMLRANPVPLLVAGVWVIGGILFKLSAAPMHIWTPDVYQKAPTVAVAFFSIVPKLAGFAILIKWLLFINLFGLGPWPWPKIMGGIALITLTIGNFSALWQTNVKRLLAYSAIAHSGFLLLGVVAFSGTGLNSLLFYAGIYLIMSVLVFLLVNLFEERLGIREIKEYSGLAKQFPFLTLVMTIAMVALTGLPPTAGFTAKLFVFSAVWESYTLTDSTWLLVVFIFGLINVVVALFYYLKIPYVMIFKSNQSDKMYIGARVENFLAIILVLALLGLFFKPDWLMNMINSINFAF